MLRQSDRRHPIVRPVEGTAVDDEPFEAVFRVHYGRVFALAHRMLGDAQEADEVAQQTFLTLYRKPLPPGREHNTLAWLLTVATNRCLNLLRAERRRQARERRAADVPPTVAADGGAAALVRATLARLPQRQVQLLLLRQAGFAYAEIAAALGVAPGSVGSLLARAERAFRQEYTRLEEQDHHGRTT